jgi:hypothetical protein
MSTAMLYNTLSVESAIDTWLRTALQSVATARCQDDCIPANLLISLPLLPPHINANTGIQFMYFHKQRPSPRWKMNEEFVISFVPLDPGFKRILRAQGMASLFHVCTKVERRLERNGKKQIVFSPQNAPLEIYGTFQLSALHPTTKSGLDQNIAPAALAEVFKII